MANYTSHAIMSEKLYNNLKSKNMLKVNIDINHLKLFSLGQDLTFVGRETFLDTHLNNSRKFFIDTIKYIRDNHLENDPLIMSYLYGHIAHYALDITIHPLIGKIIKDEKIKSVIKPHTVIECQLDKYLLNKYYCDSYDYSFLRVKYIKDKKIRNIINNTYRNVYKSFDAQFLYKYSILLIRTSNVFIQKLYKNNNMFNKLSRIESYSHNNKFYKYINIDKYNFKKDMDKIINKSIDLSSKLIKTANNYLYENKKVKILYYAFDNTPYDIGTIEEEFKYNNIPIYSKTNLEIKKV